MEGAVGFLALKLCKTPAEIRAMPPDDAVIIIESMLALDEKTKKHMND